MVGLEDKSLLLERLLFRGELLNFGGVMVCASSLVLLQGNPQAHIQNTPSAPYWRSCIKICVAHPGDVFMACWALDQAPSSLADQIFVNLIPTIAMENSQSEDVFSLFENSQFRHCK